MPKVDIDIKPINSTKKEDKPLPNPMWKQNIIPNHPARVYYSGKSGSGKTTTMINILTMYKYYFHEIHIFSPTFYDDNSWKSYMNDYEHKEKLIEVHDSLDLDSIEAILMDSQEDITENGLRHGSRKLIILDDVIDSKNMNKEIMKTLFFKSRHWSISVWISSQSYMELPRPLRLNLSNIFVFKPDNSEIKRIIEEQSNIYIDNKEDFEAIIKDACFSEKNSFLHINKQVPPEDAYRKTLKYIYTIKKEFDKK